MNAFAAYGDETAYRGLPKKQEKAAQGVSKLEEMQAEKGRLQRAYKRSVRQRAREIITLEPRLKAFRRYLKAVQIGDDDELIEAIEQSWLPASPEPVKEFALKLVDERHMRLNLLAGRDLFDEPWPVELGGTGGQSFWRRACEVLRS